MKLLVTSTHYCNMGFIYKIVNDVNDKIYIGQTTTSLKKRWKAHYDQIGTPKACLIHKAMGKYGSSHFQIIEIEEVPNEQLDEREIYWIKYYNSYYNGYNMTFGGNSTKPQNKKPVNQYDILGNYLNTYDSISAASLEFGLESDGIAKVANYFKKGKNITAAGYQWRFTSEEFPIGQNIEPISLSGHQEKPICQYDLDGNFIKEYKNIEEASKATNTSAQNIRKCVKHQGRNKAGGYQWRYSWEKL